MEKITISAVKYALNRGKNEGTLLVAASQRLCSEFEDESTTLNWLLVGDGINQIGYPQLSLTIEGSTKFSCQRCLTPLILSINSKSIIILAKDEENADLVDSLLENSDSYVVACETTLNVTELIEDEVLLHLPSSPKHYPICPSNHLKLYEDTLEITKDTQKLSFKVLENLRCTNS